MSGMNPHAFIVAFLAAISAGDIAMLTWAGYPNVITLMLIPLIFYLYLQRHRFSTGVFLAATSLLVSVIFLTETLSAAMFILITVTTVFFASIFSKRIGVPRRQFFYWLLPIILGGLLASPYLIELAPLYFGPQGTLTGEVSAITEALLSTRLVPVEFVILSLIPVFAFFLLSKLHKGKFITLPTILFAMWILVPSLLTQSYLVGVYVDYQRFLYFLSLPVIVFVGFLIDHESHIFSAVTDYLLKVLRKEFPAEKIAYPKILLRLSSRVTPYLGRKNMYSAFVCLFVILSLIFLPIFMTPNVAIAGASFYQVMTDPGYEAVQWVKDQTPVGSVCVTDALYGWWLSGFAERPTLSAVDPQYLIVAREFEPATVASNSTRYRLPCR